MMTPRCKPSACESCPLYSHGTDFTEPEGMGTLRVCVVAEASGEGEARDGLPLRPFMPSGAIFERTLRRLGLSRDQFVVTNCLRCRPIGNLLEGMSYEQEALTTCSENLAAVLRKYKPKVLLALGNVALRHLTGMAGTQRGVGHLRGYVLRALRIWEEAAGRDHDSDPLLVIPTYHPAFLRRGAIHLTGVLARDIARAVNVAAGRDQNFILDLPDLTLSAADCPYDPVDNPDVWDVGYADWEQRRKQQIQSDLAAWLTKHNLRYQLHPTRRDLDLFCRDVKARSDSWLALSPDTRAADYLCLSHDIETFESASLDEDATDGFTDTQVRLSQFSIEPSQGIALQWDKDGIAATRWLLKLPLPKVGHNYWLFDQKVLKAVGERDFGDPKYFMPAGTVHDTLQQFHFFQADLPAHLQFAASFSSFPFPWKHYSDQCLEFYGLVDTDATLRVYQTTRKTMEDRKTWWDSASPLRQAAGYVAQVEQVRPILAAMEDRGLPVDDQKRLALGVEFEAAEKEARAELDSRFPDEARKIQPYKTVPDAVKAMLEEIVPTMMPAADLLNEKGKPLGKGARTKLEKEALAARRAAVTAGESAVIRQRRFQDSPTKNDEGELEEGEWYFFDRLWLKPNETGKKMVKSQAEELGAGLQWCRVYEFSPNSSPQLISYMTAHRHKIPQSKEGKNTTGKKELIRLAARQKDNFYTKVIECRELSKAKSTYVDGFRPHSDGRVHTTFTFATAIGQTSSRNPNVQNFQKHGRLAKATRQMIAAEPGKVLTEWDFKSCHVLTLGYLAGDENYCVVPTTRLLTTDLRWKQAGDIEVGDKLVGFGESNRLRRGTPVRRQALLETEVDAVAKIIRPCITIQTDMGSVTCSTDHLWFARYKQAGHYRWLRADQLKVGWQIAYFVRPWEEDTSYDGGWLSGILDGEGSVHTRGGVTVSQKTGLVLEKIISTLVSKGFEINPWKPMPNGVVNIHITGEQFSWLRALGMFRPLRLLAKAGRGWIGMVPFSKKGKAATIISLTDIGEREVCAIATKSGNFVAEGMLSHNCRLARIDMHSIMTGHFLKLWRVQDILRESDQELKERCRWLKSNEKYKDIRDSKIKHAGLGIGNGLRANGLYERYMEFFSGVAEAKSILAAYEEVFPKVFAWQKKTQQLAHEQTFLQTEFGHSRYYYEVFRWDSRAGTWGHGDQGEEAISFWLSNIAFGHIREKMKELERAGLAERYGLCNMVHDSFVMHFDERLLEEHLRLVRPILESPSKVLIGPAAPEGLWIGVDCAVGKNWGEMKEVAASKPLAIPVVPATSTSEKVLTQEQVGVG